MKTFFDPIFLFFVAAFNYASIERPTKSRSPDQVVTPKNVFCLFVPAAVAAVATTAAFHPNTKTTNFRWLQFLMKTGLCFQKLNISRQSTQQQRQQKKKFSSDNPSLCLENRETIYNEQNFSSQFGVRSSEEPSFPLMQVFKM